jgi:hypothetical protein
MGARGLSQPGGMVEGQILKAVDSAVEGGREGLVSGVNSGNEPPPPPPSPPSPVVTSGSVESQAKPHSTNF